MKPPRADHYTGIWPTFSHTPTVHELDGPTLTGLLDQHGNALYRPKPSIGFIDFDLIRKSK